MYRRALLVIIGCAGLPVGIRPASAQAPTEVRGKLAITDRGGKQARDVADAVVWLVTSGGAKPTALDIVTRDKQFTPSVTVVGVGSTVSFPNLDPFNHNVFSISLEAPFDLGLFGRGQARSAKFLKPGIVRVYCNVHAQMWAVVVALDTPFFTQPGADGSFRLANVPAGSYTINVWHERGGSTSRSIQVAGGAPELAFELDASAFKPQSHLNKFGKPYESEGRRY